MKINRLCLLTVVGALVSLIFAAPLFAMDDDDEGIEPEFQAGGRYYAKQHDATCERINKQAAKKNNLAPMLSYAFFDPDSNSHMCLNVLWGDDISPRTFTYHITDMKGMLVEELVPPLTSSSTPLDGCNLWDVYFDDYNNDKITDFTFMIGCATPAHVGSDLGRSDNAVYLSTISEDIVWLRQREDLNKAVAVYMEYDQVKPVIQAFLSGKSYPKPPSSPPPPPPPPSAPPADNSSIGTCHYTTDNGPMSLTFNDATGAVTGAFNPQNAGTLSGVKDGIQTRGVWTLGNDQGEFEFTHETWGFWGNWKYSGDKTWRGEWEGKIVKCD